MRQAAGGHGVSANETGQSLRAQFIIEKLVHSIHYPLSPPKVQAFSPFFFCQKAQKILKIMQKPLRASKVFLKASDNTSI